MPEDAGERKLLQFKLFRSFFFFFVYPTGVIEGLALLKMGGGHFFWRGKQNYFWGVESKIFVKGDQKDIRGGKNFDIYLV